MAVSVGKVRGFQTFYRLPRRQPTSPKQGKSARFLTVAPAVPSRAWKTGNRFADHLPHCKRIDVTVIFAIACSIFPVRPANRPARIRERLRAVGFLWKHRFTPNVQQLGATIPTGLKSESLSGLEASVCHIDRKPSRFAPSLVKRGTAFFAPSSSVPGAVPGMKVGRASREWLSGCGQGSCRIRG